MFVLRFDYSKAEGVDYLSDAQYLATVQPGPTAYKADHTKVKPRVIECKFGPPKEKKSWRPVKTKEPDCASYENAKAKNYCLRSSFVHRFAAPKDAEGADKVEKETFTTQATRAKKYVPGVGSYKPKYDYVAVPYGRKRL